MNTIQWLWNSIEVLMILGVSIIIIGIILFFDYAFCKSLIVQIIGDTLVL